MFGRVKQAAIKRIGRGSIRSVLRTAGFDPTHWVRVVPYRECDKRIAHVDRDTARVFEISPGEHWRNRGFKNYEFAYFPEFDICTTQSGPEYDVVIADQVFEHVAYPWLAARNVHSMLKPGGTFVLLAPFMLKVHGYPIDCTRWTEMGLRHLLLDAGFADQDIQAGMWGNRSAVIANLRSGWRMHGWGRNLQNDPRYPVMSWAVARKN